MLITLIAVSVAMTGFGWYNAESAEGPPRRISHSDDGAGFSAYQHRLDPSIPALQTRADGGRTDWILTGLAVITVGAAVVGIVRARWWARRRLTRNPIVTAVRLLPALLGWLIRDRNP